MSDRITTLLSVTGIDTLAEVVSQGLVDDVRAQLAGDQSNEQIPEAVQKAISIMEKHVDDQKGVFMQGLKDAYSATFDEDELDELVKFYQSPVGKRLVALGGIAVPKAQEWIQTWQTQTMMAVQADMSSVLSSMTDAPVGTQAKELPQP